MRRRLEYLLFGCVSGTLASTALVLGERVFVPMHAKGKAQAILSIVNATCSMLQLMPGRILGQKRLIAGNSATAMDAHAVTSWIAIVVAFVTYAIVGMVLWWCWRALRAGRKVQRTSEEAGRPEQAAEPEASRRRLLIRGAQVAAVSAAGVAAYSVFVRPRWLRIDRVTIALRDLPAELDGLRIAQLTDIHVGPWLSRGQLDSIVDRTNELKPDMIALTGDYVSERQYVAEYVAQAADAMSRLRAKLGVFAVRGNHDYYDRGHAARRELTRVGIQLIENTHVFVTPQRTLAERTDRGLCLAGIGDLWFGQRDYDAALGSVGASIPRILLSHNPDIAEEPAFLNCPHRVDLILAGHTHGGQVRLGPIHALHMATRYGTKYAHGLVQGPRCPVYISAGTGVAVLPVRFNVPPEISLIELRSRSAS